MNKSLSNIIKDNTSGSTDLLLKLARLLDKNKKNFPELKRIIKDAQRHLSSFGVIINYLDTVTNSLAGKNEKKLYDTIKAPLQKENVFESIFKESYEYIKDFNKVFTFSNSRTIYKIILLLYEANRKLNVLMTESRPGNEGKILAGKFLAKNIPVRYGTDAAMAKFIRESDAVFCGADKLFNDGSIVNKTGSLTAAIMAEYFKKPFYVFAESGKISSSFKMEKKDPGEVWKFTQRKLKTDNYYFEVVPAELISGIFTGQVL